jgi:flavin-binding protein dodecin
MGVVTPLPPSRTGRGSISDGAISHYQVTMKVGMRLDDPS